MGGLPRGLLSRLPSRFGALREIVRVVHVTEVKDQDLILVNINVYKFLG